MGGGWDGTRRDAGGLPAALRCAAMRCAVCKLCWRVLGD
jgi:hypothetical protein